MVKEFLPPSVMVSPLPSRTPFQSAPPAHGCHVPEYVPTLPLAARVRLDLLDDWNAANKAAREAYRARPFADQRCR